VASPVFVSKVLDVGSKARHVLEIIDIVDTDCKMAPKSALKQLPHINAHRHL